jgi:hypothetical protein
VTAARDRLAELEAKVDAFFDRVHARHRSAMQCASGCSACCQPGLSITAIEAAGVRAALAALPPDRRQALRARARRGEGQACAALEDDGRCAVYAARPLVCRSHGVPVRVARPSAGRRLPVVEVCRLNFVAGLDAVGADEILDQTTLSTVLLALDVAHAAEQGRERGQRSAIASLVAEADDGST